MKDQMDTRTLLVFLLHKMSQVAEFSSLSIKLKDICIILSKQVMSIQTQERMHHNDILLSPTNDFLLMKETYTVEEFLKEIMNLFSLLENITHPYYLSEPIFESDVHSYITSSLNSFIEFLEKELKVKQIE